MNKPIEHRYYRTRDMLRNMLRKQYGNKGLRMAWHRYQEENRGKRKTFVETRIEG